MKNDGCDRYLEEPDTNRAHLDGCEECRLLFAALESHDFVDPVAVPGLPLAPWEDAGHKPWALAGGGLVAIVLAILALDALAGLSLSTVLREPLLALRATPTVVSRTGELLHRASPPMQGLFAIAVVAVNLLLVALLRRAPRGVDAAR